MSGDSDMEKRTENLISNFKENLQQMPRYMRTFSLSMRSLYSDKAVGTDNEVAIKFRKLRDDTRKYAMVYLKGVLPISTKFVSSIKEYFEYYEALSYEEWCNVLPDILDETKTYKEFAQTVLEMHEEMLVSLKQRQDAAKIIMTEFKELQEEYEMQIKKLKEKAETNIVWAHTFEFIPIINSILSPLLELSADENRAKSIAQKAEAEIQGAAALIVAEILIPALSHFVEGLAKAPAFFSVMEKELEEFGDKGEKGCQSPKKLYYTVMNKEAENVQLLCQEFYAVLPAVRTDFQVIPDIGTHQNYVDMWLMKKKEEIAKKKRENVFKFLTNIFKATGKALLQRQQR